MAFKLDGKTLPVDVPFTSAGINYPANWLRLTTLDEKKAIGITEVSDEPTYDQRFYWGVDNPKDLTQLKKDWLQKQKDIAASLLSKYDWYVTRKSEKGIDIPDTIQTYRDDIRTACNAREAEISGANNVSTIEAYVTKPQAEGGFTPWPIDPNRES